MHKTVTLERFRLLVRVSLVLVFLVIFAKTFAVEGHETHINVMQTWIEHANRLIGAVAGLAMLIVLAYALVGFNHRRRFIVMSLLACLLLGIQAWLGSRELGPYLVAYAVNIHMALALLIVTVLLFFDHLLGLEPDLTREDRSELRLNQIQKWLLSGMVGVTAIQVFLGVQVRVESEASIWNQVLPSSWFDNDIGLPLHRSSGFGLAFLVAIFAVTAVTRRRAYPRTAVLSSVLVVLVLVQVALGMVLEFAGMPALVKPLHLVCATALFGVEMLVLFRALTPLPRH